MGKNVSKFMPKYIRDFNLENRVFKKIEQQKAEAAPRYPHAAKYYEQLEKSAPTKDEIKENLKVTEMAKQINLVSKGDNPEIKTRALPQDRESSNSFLYGYKEPEKIPAGKLSLKMLNTIVLEYKKTQTPQKVEELATLFRLDRAVVDNIVDYYRPFKMITSGSDEKLKKDKDAMKVINSRINNLFLNVDKENAKLQEK